MIRRIFLLGFLLMFLRGYSQQNWINTGGGNANDEALDIAVDANGNILTTGYFSQSASFGSTTISALGSGDVFIASQDSTGTYNWIRSAGGTDSDRGNSLACDPNGNVFVTGTFSGTAMFDTMQRVSAGLQDIFLAKLDAGGNWMWVKTIGSADNDVAYAVTSDQQGNAVLTGQFKGTLNLGIYTFTSAVEPVSQLHSYDILIAKFDASGNLLWAKQGAAKYDDRGMSITTDINDNIVVCGQYSDTLTFSTAYTNNGFNNAFLMKLDSNGNEIWFRKISALLIAAYDVVAKGNDIYLTGDHKGSVLVQSVPMAFLSSSHDNNVFVMMFNSSGNVEWKTSLGSDNPVSMRGLAVDNSGKVWTSGYFKCSMSSLAAQYGDGLFLSAGHHDVLLLGFDANGNRVAERQYGGAGDDFSCGLVTTVSGRPILAGSYSRSFNVPGYSFSALTPQTVELNYNGPSSQCGSVLHGYFGQVNAAGLKDVYTCDPYAVTQSRYDYFMRIPGNCGTGIINGYINYNEDTLRGCDSLRVFPNTQTSVNGVMAPLYKFNWSIGSVIDSIFVDSTQWLFLTAETEDGCRSFTDSVYAEIYESPSDPQILSSNGTIETAIPHMGCYNKLTLMAGDSSILTGTNITNGYAYKWITPYGVFADTTQVLANMQGVYTFQVISPNGYCISSICVGVFYYQNGNCQATSIIPQLVFHEPDFEITDTVRVCFEDFFKIELVDSTFNANAIPTFLNTFVSWTISGGYQMYFPLSWPYTYNTHVQEFQALSDGPCTVSATIFDPLTHNPYLTVTRNFYLDVVIPPVNNPQVGGATNICPGDTVWLTVNGGDNYTWNGPGIIANSADNDSVLVVNEGLFTIHSITIDTILGCMDEKTIQYELQQIPRPLISMLPDHGVICPGDSVLLAAEPGSNFEWYGPLGNVISTSQQCYVAVPGEYHYNYINQSGCSLVSEFAEVLQYSTPYLEAFPGTSLCGSGPVELTVVTNAQSQVNWDAPISSVGLTQIVDTAGIYTASVNFCSITTSVSITITDSQNDVTILAATDSICPGDTAVLIATGNFVSFEWSANQSGSNVMVVSQPGDYYVLATDGEGCIAGDSISIYGLPGIDRPLVSDTAVCAGSNVTLFADADYPVFWYESPFSTTAIAQGDSLNITIGGSAQLYFVTQSNGVCSSEAEAVEISLLAGSTIPAFTGDFSACPGDSIVFGVDSMAGLNYLWSGPNGFYAATHLIQLNNIQSGDAGYYQIQVSDSICSSFADSVFIAVGGSELSYWNGMELSACVNDSLLILADTLAGTYEWNTGETTTEIFGYPGIAYSFIHTDTLFCVTYSDTLVIDSLPTPQVPVLSDTVICPESPFLFQYSQGNGTISWYSVNAVQLSANDTVYIPSVSQATHLIAVLTDSSGCHSSDTMLVDPSLLPEAPFVESDGTFCEGTGLELSAESDYATSYIWLLPDGTVYNGNPVEIDSLSAMDNGLYQVQYSNGFCLSEWAGIDVTVILQPQINITGDTLVCEGTEVLLLSNSADQVMWEDGTSDQHIILTEVQSEYITATATNSCGSVSDSLFVTILGSPVANAGADQIIQPGSGVHLNGNGVGQYEWYPPLWLSCSNCQNPISNPLNNIDYILTVTASNGCSDSDTVSIEFYIGNTCYVPSAFTPDGDGINDEFKISGSDIVEMQLLLFNRWGQLVFQSSDPARGWDGQFKNEKAEAGMYVWYLNAKFSNGTDLKNKGNLMLIR